MIALEIQKITHIKKIQELGKYDLEFLWRSPSGTGKWIKKHPYHF
jgi:hypothetical protein